MHLQDISKHMTPYESSNSSVSLFSLVGKNLLSPKPSEAFHSVFHHMKLPGWHSFLSMILSDMFLADEEEENCELFAYFS